jgi:hypothetical protein
MGGFDSAGGQGRGEIDMTDANTEEYSMKEKDRVKGIPMFDSSGLSSMLNHLLGRRRNPTPLCASGNLGAPALVALVACLALGLQASPAHAFDYGLLSQFGSTGSQQGQLLNPQGVAIDQVTHDVYVADTGNHRVEKFSGSGTFIAAWGWGVSDGKATSEVCTSSCQAGQEGSGEGEFTTPVAIAVDNSAGPSHGDVYVVDEGNESVEKFNSSGIYIPSFAAQHPESFGSVYGVAVDNSGNVWVAAHLEAGESVYELESDGAEIKHWSTRNSVPNKSVNTPGFGVGANEMVYADLDNHLEKFSSFGIELGELESSSTSTVTGLATNLVSGNVFVDEGGFIAKYDAGPTAPAGPVTSFGQDVLIYGTYFTGLGADVTTGEVYVTDASTGEVYVFGPPPAGSPQLESITVRNVSPGSAELDMRIYTGQYDTKYHIEYGTTEAYGNVVPAAEEDIGSDGEEITVSQTLSNLTPHTTYHYRVVATNSHGVAASTDSTITTSASEASSSLPDERGYELVSPVEKNGGDVETTFGALGGAAPIQAAVSGDAVSYESITSFAGSPSSKSNEYMSTRGADGWSTQPLSPAATLREAGGLQAAPYESLSDELSMGVMKWVSATLTPEAPIGYENLYVHNNVTGSYELITETAPANGSASTFVGASSDYSHVAFETGDALTENAIPNSQNVYEWSHGQLSLASILPGSNVGAPASGGGDGHGNVWNAVSSNGQLIFWTDGEGQLYAREHGVSTVKINASQRSVSLGDGSATYEGATSSGERVIFSDATALTNDTEDHGGLYEFDTSNGALTDITPDANGSPALLGVVGIGDEADNGTPYVYFVAEDILATGGTAGRPNLYVAHGGRVSFVGTLSGEDSGDWATALTERHAAVSPDGMHMVFMSVERLTGYDNSEDGGGGSDTEVFEYDAEAGQLHCVSCNPTGEAPIGPSSVPVWASPGYDSDYLSTDGDRVFFDSSDALSPRDTNGRQDVYEWERAGVDHCAPANGCVYLISAGTSANESTFYAASASGDDVFFGTRSQLVPEDTDEDVDLYDARVDGGVAPVSTPVQCSGEACLGPLEQAPLIAPPATASLLPSEGTSGGDPNRSPSFKLAAIGSQALKRFVKTGKLTMFATVSSAGEVWIKMTTPVGRGDRQVAYASAHVAEGASIPVKLTLTKYARHRLVADRKLELRITGGYSKTAVRRHVTVTLSTLGSAR